MATIYTKKIVLRMTEQDVHDMETIRKVWSDCCSKQLSINDTILLAIGTMAGDLRYQDMITRNGGTKVGRKSKK